MDAKFIFTSLSIRFECKHNASTPSITIRDLHKILVYNRLSHSARWITVCSVQLFRFRMDNLLLTDTRAFRRIYKGEIHDRESKIEMRMWTLTDRRLHPRYSLSEKDILKGNTNTINQMTNLKTDTMILLPWHTLCLFIYDVRMTSLLFP